MDQRFALFAVQNCEEEIKELNKKINQIRESKEAELSSLKERFSEWTKSKTNAALSVEDFKAIFCLPIEEIDCLAFL